MRLESVTLSGFRCFEPDLLKTYCKVFGVSRAERNIQRADFHLAADADPDDRTTKDLVIDVLIALPELADGTATPETVAPSFRHMLISREDKAPVCRMRLEARWEDDTTVEGEVSQGRRQLNGS